MMETYWTCYFFHNSFNYGRILSNLPKFGKLASAKDKIANHGVPKLVIKSINESVKTGTISQAQLAFIEMNCFSLIQNINLCRTIQNKMYESNKFWVP